MKRLGFLLMIGGAAVGVAVAVGVAGGFHLALPWIASIAVAKLTLAASGGLMAAGAFVRRLGLRRETRSHLLPYRDDISGEGTPRDRR